MKLTPSSSKKLIRRTWIENMESGKYRKANGYLHRVNTESQKGEFCALGVLCDMAVQAGVIPEPRTYDQEGNWRLMEFEDETGSLPEKVKEWAGMSDESGTFEYKGRQVNIPMLNDGGSSSTDKAKSLKQIAKIIRTCPKGLFTEE